MTKNAAKKIEKQETPSGKDPRHLERVTLLILRILRLLMESGSAAKVLHEAAQMMSKGLGVDLYGLRVGYASMTLTLAKDDQTLSRMTTVGRIGVNHRVDHLLRELILKISKQRLPLATIDREITKIISETPRHMPWIVALCVGIACASFGRLFGMDWLGYPAAVAGSTAGQYLRHHLIHKGMNAFVVAALIAFVASLLTGLGAMALGSTTINLAMMASILLLVPGVPAANAQADIMDGFPTLGSARAVTVLMIMIFATTGIWLSQTVLDIHGMSQAAEKVQGFPVDLGFLNIDLFYLAHQAVFGGIAAFGFGVLFNLGPRSLLWCALCGALALGVRTLGQTAHWSLEGATFAAAITVTSFVIALPRRLFQSSYNTLALSACIPMVPGAFFAQAILGLFALTAPHPENEINTIVMAMEYILRVTFTIGAIGAGIAIPTHIFKTRDF